MVLDNQLPRSTPQTQGIDPAAILAFINAAERAVELHSFMLLRHGSVVAEGWWSPYAADRPHLLHSLSKSFTSTAIGLAVAEGRLTVNDPILSHFPEYRTASVSDHLASMQVKHLLSMSTGHAVDTTPLMKARADGKWTAEFFAQPVVYAPGTHFLYNSGATYVLSALIQRLTGMPLLDYLQPRLLDPLGIRDARTEISPEGIHCGGWGMSLRTEDLARFGQLYLQKGLWHGQRLISEAWIAEATSKQVSNEGSNPNMDWVQGYGYQFWRCRHGAYRGDGALGQFCIVMPDQDAVVVITSGVKDMQPVLDLVWDYLLPTLSSDSAIQNEGSAQDALTKKLASLALFPPTGPASSSTAAKVSKRTYTVAPNDLKIETISFEFSESVANIYIRTSQGEQYFTCGLGAWQEGTLDLFGHSPMLAASGVWSAEDSLTLTLRFYETPLTVSAVCQFTRDQLHLEMDVFPAAEPGKYSLVGKAD